MSQAFPTLTRLCAIVLAPALASCASQAPPQTETPSQEQRLLDLERRVEQLEARPAVQHPYRNAEEIEAHINSLEEERAKLLTSYLPQHPAIRDIDRRLEILHTQLRMLKPAP